MPGPATAMPSPTGAIDPRALVVAIALVSAGALAYQLLLMRWLAIAHWHPFAAMIISLALLGHGASGTWLGLQPDRARRRFDTWFPACALAFAVSAVAVLPLAARLPFNGLELVWNPRQLVWLAALYLALALPFFFAAGCFGLAFARHGGRIPRLYGADLLGAGAGALLGLALMWRPLPDALAIAAACGALAVTLVLPRRRWPLPTAAFAVVLALWGTGALEPPLNPYKGQARVLLLPGARVLAQHDSPYGRLTVVESAQVPLRHQVGLSLHNVQEPAPQLGVFVDGDAMSVLTHEMPPARLAYLDRTLAALPYRLVARPRVLVLGAAGSELLLARRHGARAIDIVDPDARRLQLPCRDFAAYAGPVCAGVALHAASPRAFVRACARDRARCGGGAHHGFDLVVLAGEDSLAAASAGVQAASEQFALTTQALADDLRVLAPGGVLAVVRYAKSPPRDELKLWATLVAALRRTGADDPGRHLLALRGWDATLLVAARDPLTPAQRAQARAFADAQGFVLVHAGDDAGAAAIAATPAAEGTGAARAAEGAGAATRAADPGADPLAPGLRALLSADASAFVRDYRFAIAPASDDRPYFADFFRWRSLPELWRLREAGGAVLLDAGYLLLIAALAQAVPLAAVLVVLPLLGRRRRSAPAVAAVRADEAVADDTVAAVDDVRPSSPLVRVAIYFVTLGLAFLMIEIVCLTRLALLVGHALTATAVGLAGFLVFAGLGSLAVQRRAVTPARAVLAIALGLAWHLGSVAWLQDLAAAWPIAPRALAGLASVAPLAWAMGRPFPLGLARLAREAPAWVPWAWALNGFASVVAAIAALMLAMAVGGVATLLVAMALYVVAAAAWPGPAPLPQMNPAVIRGA